MADKKISQLSNASTPLAGTETVPLVQSGSTVKTPVSDLTAGRAVSAASYAVTGSTAPANGTYLPAANTLAFSVNSAEMARLTSAGLGLSAGNNPTQKISLYATGSTAQYMSAGNSNTGVNGSIFGVDATGNTVINNTQVFAMLFSTSNAERLRISSDGNVVVNTAAVATTATTGFLWIGSCAGAPTGAPTAPYSNAAAMVADTTNNRLYVRVGSTWRFTALT
jgi:hypothetical protein